MAADATIALISGGSAIVGGLLGGGLGYIGVQKQQKEERRRAHLQSRQGAYNEFIDSVMRFYRTSGSFDLDVASYVAWLHQYDAASLALQIYGTERVRRAASGLQEVVMRIIASIGRPAEGVTAKEFSSDLSGAVSWHEEEFQAALTSTIHAMREDVDPDG